MNYKVIDHIDTGGFGKVEEVVGDDGKHYAKKTFQLDQRMIDQGLEDNAKRRFIQEADFQASFEHKNVVPVIELFLDQNPPYFIMPLAEASLEKDARDGKVDISNFMEPILDVLSGLEEIHSIAIFHRDLKPSNVLRFTDDEGNSYYAIGDFGLMSLKQRTGFSSLTSTGMGKTSDLYTSPEVHYSLKNASAASDIYSVGCIIHDFVGGSRVPCGEIKDKSPYADILDICTKSDPKKRFQDIPSFRDMLATIDPEIFESKTETGTKISDYLDQDPKSLVENELEEIVNYLENDAEDHGERKNALLQIDLSHIQVFKDSSLLPRFASVYCDFIQRSSFQFSTCDALASRIDLLIREENASIQTDGIMALLFMGTGHNRWHVEYMFVKKVGTDADINVMKRLNMQFRVEGKNICSAINHLTYSIHYELKFLHPLLLSTVEKVCKLR